MTSANLAQGAEVEAAMAPLQNYIRAHETGRAESIRQAFAADARIGGHLGGKLVSLDLEQYASRFDGTAAADEAQRKRSAEIVDLTVDAAVAKVVLDYPAVKFVDYMSSIKIDGEWKIVGKSFHAQPKTTTV